MGMPKAVRILLKTLLVIVVVVVLLLLAVTLFIGPIVKTAAEKIGPKVLGVPVTVERVSINAFAGKVGLKNLRVGNPDGYSTDPMFALGELRLDVNLASLPGSGPIEVTEVAILDPKVSYEIVKGTSNIDALTAGLQKAPAEEPAATEGKKPARKVIVNHFECRGGEVSVRAAITLGKSVTVPLPQIVANDIGKSTGGTSTFDAIQKMVGEIASGVGKAAVGVLSGVGDAAKDAAKGVQDAGKGAVDKIKGLF